MKPLKAVYRWISRFENISGKRFCRLLEGKCWKLKRINGSHHEVNAKVRLCSITRQKRAKKRSLHVVNEHFERVFNEVRGRKMTFAYSSPYLRKGGYDGSYLRSGSWRQTAEARIAEAFATTVYITVERSICDASQRMNSIEIEKKNHWSVTRVTHRIRRRSP